ncbi:DUF4401 domain-containing protein [Myxococcaceae bacterium GXIMD 01537]
MALKPTLRDVLTRLQAAGTLPADAIPRAQAPLDAWWKAHGATPWYVRIFIGGGAWMAAFFLTFFFGLLFGLSNLDDSAVALTLTGLLVTGGALMLRRQSGHDFVAQLTLAVGLTGQVLIVVGVGSGTESAIGAATAALVLETLLVFIHPDRTQRFLSTGAAAVAALFLLHEAGSVFAVDVGLVALAVATHLAFLNQARRQAGPWGGLAGPVSFGLVTVLFGGLLGRTWTGRYTSLMDRPGTDAGVLLTLGVAAVTLYTVSRILREQDVDAGGPAGVTAFASLGLTALLTLHTPGIIAAAGILALAFHRRSVVLLGMAIAFLLGFGVHYYYDLSLSLLAKSLALLGSGLVMFGLRLVVQRLFPAAPEAQ